MQSLQDLFAYRFIASKKESPNLMVVFHGRGDSVKPFQHLNDELKLYDFNYLLLNAPRKYEKGYSWYGEPPYKKNGVLRIRERVFRLLGLLEDQGWESENIYLLGHSQGALVASDIALYYPKRLGGVIGVSGYFHFFPRWRKNIAESARQTPFLFTHGRNDEILDIDETYFGVKQLQSIGLNVDWIELNKAHDFVPRELPLIRKWINEQRL